MTRRQSKVAKVVKMIKDNGSRCALSGWEISPQCFELDHIVSMNDGGTDDIENLQAVHPLVNRAKGTMGNQQFIDMCKSVAMYAANKSKVDQHLKECSTSRELDQVREIVKSALARPPVEVGSADVQRN
jgi:hypothetical protein